MPEQGWPFASSQLTYISACLKNLAEPTRCHSKAVTYKVVCSGRLRPNSIEVPCSPDVLSS
jgi:hypothetical protein